MTGLSQGPAQAMAARFPWRDHRTVFDIGCADGGLPVRLASEHPHLTGGGFDYTGADCMGWMRQAGFREARTEHLVGPLSMVVGVK
jgi:tRNA G46 methylase TrmB